MTDRRFLLAREADHGVLEPYEPAPICGGITTHASVAEAEAARGVGDPETWAVWAAERVGGGGSS